MQKEHVLVRSVVRFEVVCVCGFGVCVCGTGLSFSVILDRGMFCCRNNGKCGSDAGKHVHSSVLFFIVHMAVQTDRQAGRHSVSPVPHLASTADQT